MRRFCLCSLCLVLWLAAALAQDCKKTEYNADHQKYMETALQQFSSCQPMTDATCRAALAQAVDHVYGVKDFGGSPRYLTPAEIAKKVKDDAGWEHLGSASDQEALKKAASGAACGQAVLAVMASDTGGHVSMILPGALTHSNGWNLEVPSSASFFVNKPGKSFAGKPLSYSFTSPQGVELYAKK